MAKEEKSFKSTLLAGAKIVLPILALIALSVFLFGKVAVLVSIVAVFIFILCGLVGLGVELWSQA